ncbi:MAG: FlgD immunoglobulin-like domain containing protein [Fibrobacterota bacterium]
MNHMSRPFFLAAGLVCLALAVAFADTTYIATKSAQIPGQFSKLQPGDTLLIQPGTYNYPSVCSSYRDGTAEKPIVARAAAPNTVFIKHSNEEMFVANHRYYIIENLNINGMGYASVVIKFNDNGLTGGQYWQMRNCILTQFGESSVKAGWSLTCTNDNYPGDFSILEGNEITSDTLGIAGNGNGFNLDGPEHMVIRNNWIHDLVRSQGSSAGDLTYSGFFKGGAAHNIIEGNIIGPGQDMMGFCFGGGCMAPGKFRDNRSYETDDIMYRNNVLLNIAHLEYTCGPNLNRKVYHNTIIYCTGTIAAEDIRNNLILGGTVTVNGGTNNYKSTTYSSAYFWDPANRNYALKTTATALIGQVARFDSVLTDKLGTARPAMVSYGAYEAYGTNPGTAVEVAASTLPEALTLDIQPNPVKSFATVRFALASPVRCLEVGIFDLNGRTVRVLYNGPLASGAHRLRWDGRGHTSAPVAAGVYLVRLRIDARQSVKQFVYVR